MRELLREDSGVVAAVERRMRAWELKQSTVHQSHTAHVRGAPKTMGPYVAISREAGCGGEEIARSLGHELGWDVLDKELLDRVAQRCHTSSEVLELVDETASSWLYDVVGTWLDPSLVPHEKYHTVLNRVIQAAATHGKVVLVGRGAWILLPPEAGLSVRLVAPWDYRVARVQKEQGIEEAAARALIQRTDRDRELFIREHFRREVGDPHDYDLTLNVARLGREAAVTQIIAALGQRGT